MTAFLLLVGCGDAVIETDKSSGGTDDSGTADSEPTGPDWSLGEEEPSGTGLAACTWSLWEVVREQFSGDATLVVALGTGDLAGNADLCWALFQSRSRAGMVASGYRNDGPPTVSSEPVPDLPYCTNGSVTYSTLLESPVTDWYVDSDALLDAFADVPSATLVSMAAIPPVLLPDINLCFGGNYHLSTEESVEGILVGVATDCGEEGVHCAVAIDAKSGDILDRE